MCAVALHSASNAMLRLSCQEFICFPLNISFFQRHCSEYLWIYGIFLSHNFEQSSSFRINGSIHSVKHHKLFEFRMDGIAKAERKRTKNNNIISMFALEMPKEKIWIEKKETNKSFITYILMDLVFRFDIVFLFYHFF